MLGLNCAHLNAQSYETAFEPLTTSKMSRKQFKNEFLSIEPATGFAGLTVPLGPGIGARGIGFVPTVRMHMSPKNTPNPVYNWAAGFTREPVQGVLLWDQTQGSTLNLSPQFWRPSRFAFEDPHGSGSIVMFPEQADPHQQIIWWDLNTDESSLRSLDTGYANHKGGLSSFVAVLPGGESVSAQSSYAFDEAGNPVNLALANQYASLLQDFGYAPSDISPWGAVQGTQGYLIFALKGTNGQNATYTDASGPMGALAQLETPARLLVVKGATGVEFTYAGIRLRPWSPKPAEGITIPDQELTGTIASTIGYLPSRIRNRFNDAIEFSYSPDGLGFTAALKINGNATGQSVALSYVSNDGPHKVGSLPAEIPSVMHTALGKVQMRVSYAGGNVGEYLVTAWDATDGLWGPQQALTGDRWGLASHHLGEKRRLLECLQIQQPASGFNLKVDYKQLEFSGPYPGLTQPITPAIRAKVFDRITFPNGEVVALDYAPYFFFSAFSRSDAENSVLGGHPFPPLAWGVQTMTRTDSSTGESRRTWYERKFPTFRRGSNPLHWDSLEFWEAEGHPDGQVVVRKFVPPPQDSAAPPTASPEVRMQAYLFSKNTVFETATYAPGADWRAEVNAPVSAASTLQYATKWALHQLGNPSGLVHLGGTALPTQQVSWNRYTSVAEQQLTSGWDSGSQMWGTSTRGFYQTSSPYSAFSLSMGALGSTGSTPAASSFPGYVLDRSTSTSYLPLDAHYFPGLWTRQEDFEKGGRRLPVQTRQVSSTHGTVAWHQMGEGALWTKVEYTYGGPAGLPTALSLKGSAGLALGQGEVGIREYGYDAHLRLKRIAQNGATWTISQESDPLLGTPTSQTDPNGLQTTYAWDEMGRLKEITPPSPEAGTTINYSPDFRSLTITRGGTSQTETYNAFGEMVSLQKAAGEIKTFRYDLGGRKVFESVWGSGSVGTTFEYNDPIFRPTRTVDPNGSETNLTYAGLSKTTIQGPTSSTYRTTFQSDPLGRLVGVTDALGQTTTYTYDSADRILGVKQDGPQGSQTRSWGYNALGWLETLVQPESGTTSYSDFTVFGKPRSTSYAGRVVSTTYDALGRVQTLSAADGSVAQGFAYDTGVMGKGKLAQSTDKGITLTFGYGGLNGRLGSLGTQLQAIFGTQPPAFTQSFAYNALGQRDTAVLPSGRTVSYTYDDPRDALKETRANPGAPGAFGAAQSLAQITAWNPADSPSTVLFGNGVSTIFSYDNDQTRLTSMTHRRPGAAGNFKQWIYGWNPTTGWLMSDGEDSYTYDALGRLKTADALVPNRGLRIQQAFEYDAFGNQTASTATGVPSDLLKNFSNFRFNPSDFLGTNRLPSTTSTGVNTGATYDAQGNLTQVFKQAGAADKAVSMAYDALGRVTQMTDSERGVTEKYFYTPEGLRTRIEIYEGSTLSKVLVKLYNDQRQLVSEYEAAATPAPAAGKVVR